MSHQAVSSLRTSLSLRENVDGSHTSFFNAHWNYRVSDTQSIDCEDELAPRRLPFPWRNEQLGSFDVNGFIAQPRVINTTARYLSTIFRRVCLSQLGSTSPSLTFDKLNSAAMISCVFVSTAKYNFFQTRSFPSVLCFLTFHLPSP